MKIRTKITLIVLPLIVGPLLLIGFSSSYAARNGITQVTSELLRFKAEELSKYAENQWNLLVENQLEINQEYVTVSKKTIESFARNMIRSDTELILAFTSDGTRELGTGEFQFRQNEKEVVLDLMGNVQTGWVSLTMGGIERVAHIVYFQPFDWYIMVTQYRDVFYQAVNQIYLQSGLILSLSLVIAIVLLILFTNHVTMPLRKIVAAMRDIISSSDLTKKVDILFRDETGELGHTFNIMTGELDKAYNQIKIYALETAIAQKKEQKIRNIFQKYVPKEVIDRYFKEPDALLAGEDRILAVLFSDIRSFTAISEGMRPSEIVESLNTYFSAMVDIIMDHKGVVDKYIGDAIMAFFGAPVKHEEDAYLALLAAFEMLSAVRYFNKSQVAKGAPEFKIGIGINYGIVTVGNIGSERKMDYTVIGDMVNLASRVEGMTKVYREELVFSEAVYRQVIHHVPCRILDRVAVKGKGTSVNIYTAKPTLTGDEQDGWDLYHVGLYHYYDREFQKAADCFKHALEILPEDYMSQVYFDRSERLLLNPPDEDWTGITYMSEK